MIRRTGDRIINVKSQRGQILRIVREHYLRNDVRCCITGCKVCHNEKPRLTFDSSHFVVPDVDTILNYFELFDTFLIPNIIIAQTILHTVQDKKNANSSKSLFRRLRDFCSDLRRSSLIFNNENFTETYFERPQHMNLDDRNFQAVLKLAIWFQRHLHKIGSKTRVILISEHHSVPNPSESEQIEILSMGEYLKKHFNQNQEMLDLFESLKQVVEEKKSQSDHHNISQDQESSSSIDKYDKDNYVSYLSEEVLEAGVKSGIFFKGKLKVNPINSKEAFVDLGEKSPLGKQMFIPNEIMRNRAIHGDIVIVSLIPKADWQKPSGFIKDLSTHKKDSQVSEIGSNLKRLSLKEGQNQENIKDEDNQASIISKEDLLPCGRIVGLHSINWRKYVCTIREEESLKTKQEGWVIAVPYDYKIPKIRIKTRQYSQIVDSRIVVAIDHWDIYSKYPQGHYIKNIGPIGHHETEMQVLLHESEVDTSQFSSQLLAELPHHSPSSPWKPSFNEPSLGPRRDLTDWRIYSIDPLGCQDIDDALSCRFLPNGNTQIGVHIADVTAFVKDGSLLDTEAQARATSVYLADRRIDMLPTLLSERLCSLRCNENRYAVSVIWEFDSEANIIDTWYGRTMINTKYEMYYGDAQDVLDDKDCAKEKFKEDYALLRKELLEFRRIYRILKEKRYSKGALELESVEVSFKLDEQKQPSAVLTKEALEIHGLVAEYMIFANVAVAQFIYKHHPEAVLLRRHPLPRDDNFDDLISLAKSKGCEIDTSSNLALAKSLSQAALKGDKMFSFMLKSLATLAMSEAEYMSSGSFDIHEFYHYGLAADFYTHFTSPIRRYADIVVHRELLAILDKLRRKQQTQTVSANVSKNQSKASADQPSTTTSTIYNNMSLELTTNSNLQSIAEHLNLKNRQAKVVQRNSRELFQALYFKRQQHLNLEDTAIVVSIKTNGFLVYLPKYGMKTALILKDSSGFSNVEPSAFKNTALQSDSVQILSFEPTNNKTSMKLHTSAGIHEVKLFDCLTVQVKVLESRAHCVLTKLQLLRFEVSSNPNIKNQPAKETIESNTLENQSKSTFGPSLVSMVKDQDAKNQKEILASKLGQELWDALKRYSQTLEKDSLHSLVYSPTSAIVKQSLDEERAFASLVLSKRGLNKFFDSENAQNSIQEQSKQPENTKSSDQPSDSDMKSSDKQKTTKKAKKPVCLISNKGNQIGRRTFQQKQYEEYFNYHYDDNDGYDYDEEYDDESPKVTPNASIPATMNTRPSNSFGSVNITRQEQERKIDKATAKAERDFKAHQFQVNKAKHASKYK